MRQPQRCRQFSRPLHLQKQDSTMVRVGSPKKTLVPRLLCRVAISAPTSQEDAEFPWPTCSNTTTIATPSCARHFGYLSFFAVRREICQSRSQTPTETVSLTRFRLMRVAGPLPMTIPTFSQLTTSRTSTKTHGAGVAARTYRLVL